MLNKIDISPSRQKLIVYVVLAVVTLAIFWQVNQFDFVNIDDNIYVTENSHIQSGITIDGFRWAFSTRYADLWHPLIWLSFMFDYQLYGMNAGGYHLTNLILHILSTLLLFWLFCRMTGAVWKSAFVAAFFALHPLHVESVVWITERKDVLSAFSWMVTLCLYVYYTEKPAIRRYILVLFSFILALMSKPMVVTLPVVMILLDYWPLKRFESRKNKTNFILWQLKEKITFFALSAVFSIMTIYAHYNKPLEHYPFSFRIANAFVSLITYLKKTFWPHDMAFFYPFPSQIPNWQVIGASLLIILISATVIVMVKRLPYLFVGWLWYLITITPVIGIIQDSDQAMADRYYYLPSIGIAVMLAWGIPLLFQREDFGKKILFPAGIAVLFILAVLTWQQCGYWKNDIELFNHTLHIVPNYTYGYYDRGTAYAKLGQYRRAIEDYNQAISMNHNLSEAYNNRGTAYAKLGQYQRAIEDFNDAIRLRPDDAIFYRNRGLTHLNQGNKEFVCDDARKACALENCQLLEAAKSEGLCR
jgi:hypothetical protein